MEAIESLWIGNREPKGMPTKWRTFNDWIAVLPHEIRGPYANMSAARRVAFLLERGGTDCAVVKQRGRYFVMFVMGLSQKRVAKTKDKLGLWHGSPYIPVQGIGYYNPFWKSVKTFGGWLKRAGTRTGRESVRGARASIRGTRRAAKWYGAKREQLEKWGIRRQREEFEKSKVKHAREKIKLGMESEKAKREELVEQWRTEREEAKTAAAVARQERMEAESARQEAERGLYGTKLQQYKQKFRRYSGYGQQVGQAGAAVAAGVTPPPPTVRPAPPMVHPSTAAQEQVQNLMGGFYGRRKLAS